jgi:hypothetical protein
LLAVARVRPYWIPLYLGKSLPYRNSEFTGDNGHNNGRCFGLRQTSLRRLVFRRVLIPVSFLSIVKRFDPATGDVCAYIRSDDHLVFRPFFPTSELKRIVRSAGQPGPSFIIVGHGSQKKTITTFACYLRLQIDLKKVSPCLLMCLRERLEISPAPQQFQPSIILYRRMKVAEMPDFAQFSPHSIDIIIDWSQNPCRVSTWLRGVNAIILVAER